MVKRKGWFVAKQPNNKSLPHIIVDWYLFKKQADKKKNQLNKKHTKSKYYVLKGRK